MCVPLPSRLKTAVFVLRTPGPPARPSRTTPAGRGSAQRTSSEGRRRRLSLRSRCHSCQRLVPLRVLLLPLCQRLVPLCVQGLCVYRGAGGGGGRAGAGSLHAARASNIPPAGCPAPRQTHLSALLLPQGHRLSAAFHSLPSSKTVPFLAVLLLRAHALSCSAAPRPVASLSVLFDRSWNRSRYDTAFALCFHCLCPVCVPLPRG